MPKKTFESTRRFGEVFDAISDDYDKHRPGYPNQLVDRACILAGLEKGDRILEIGCGSGQLTGSLVRRGYQITAVEPGINLVALAEQHTRSIGDVEYIHTKFEDATLTKGAFKAVFSASAFHWVDPNLSWKKVSNVLAPGGVLALMQYTGLKEKRTSQDLTLLFAALNRVEPEIAANWPRYYELTEIIREVELRRNNVSDAWSWLGSYDLAQSYVEHLFEDVQLVAMPRVIEQTAEQLNNVIRTISAYSRLSERQRDELEHEFNGIYEKLGRPIRSSTIGILVTARLS